MWSEVSAPSSIDAKELLSPISTFRPGAIRTRSVNIAIVASFLILVIYYLIVFYHASRTWAKLPLTLILIK